MKKALFCTYSVLCEIKKGSQSLETLDFTSSGDWTRTSDLRVMSSNLSFLTTILLGSRAINLQKRVQKRVPF